MAEISVKRLDSNEFGKSAKFWQNLQYNVSLKPARSKLFQIYEQLNAFIYSDIPSTNFLRSLTSFSLYL